MATSDEQRDALRLIVQKIAARSVEEANYSTAFKREQLAEAWAEFDAQQAPQERADEQFLYPTKEQIAEAHNRIEALLPEDEPDLVPDWVCTVLINYGRALAANPQQSTGESALSGVKTVGGPGSETAATAQVAHHNPDYTDRTGHKDDDYS